MLIGLTIVAFGTSAPELAVSLIASFKGNSAISVGNVVGSNICNMLLVLGATSLFATLNCKRKLVTRDFVYLFLSYVALFIISVGTYIESGKVGTINRVNGLLLVCFLGIYMYSLLGDAKGNMKKEENSREKVTFKEILFIIIGLIAIVGGGELVVNSATAIAKIIGISDSVIALTVVAVGTSLPELVTSVVAAKKGEDDIAIGNVIGSNIFNILMVLGIAAAISPVAFLTENIIDIAVLIVFSVLGWIMAWTKKELNRKEGIIMLLLYAVYVVYICMR